MDWLMAPGGLVVWTVPSGVVTRSVPSGWSWACQSGR
jgi:hypothetical protein